MPSNALPPVEYKENYRLAADGKNRYLKLLVLVVLIFFLTIIFVQQIKLSNSFEQVNRVTKSLALLEQENTIFRAITPVQSSLPEIITKAVDNKLLVPGWVTRIYSASTGADDSSESMDLGSFIMNETRFTLANHKSHGIETPSRALYRMNGLYVSNAAGKHQVAVNSQLFPQQWKDNREGYVALECFIHISINNENVIHRTIKLSSDRNDKKVVTGQIKLKKGIFPISSKFYCEEGNYFENKEPLFSINFRSPENFSFSNNGLHVYHIYNVNDKLDAHQSEIRKVK